MIYIRYKINGIGYKVQGGYTRISENTLFIEILKILLILSNFFPSDLHAPGTLSSVVLVLWALWIILYEPSI